MMRLWSEWGVPVVLAAGLGTLLWFKSDPEAPASQLYAQPLQEAAIVQEDLLGAERLSSAFRTAAKVIRPSVVQINALIEQRQQRFSSPFGPDLLDELFGRQRQPAPQRRRDADMPRPKVQAGVGSGVIVSTNGFVLTNNHVVEEADELQVELSDGRTFKAEVVGTDPRSDLAVLKLEADGLTAAKIGDSSNMQVGDWVIAIGSPFGLEQTVTAGIISATNRRTGILSNQGYEDFLQTDAAINPGNSGGPLINLRGEVIGINTAINSRTGTNAGVGFAIPSKMALQVMQDIRSTGHAVRGFMGAGVDSLNPQKARDLNLPSGVVRGALIGKVLPNGPAGKANLKEGDVIIALDGQPISSGDQLRNQIAMTRPGTTVKLDAIREGRPMSVRVQVEEQTEDKMALFSDRTVNKTWGVSLDTLSPQLARELDVPDTTKGAVILELDPQGQAAKLRLQPGDVILKINDSQVDSATMASELLSKVSRNLSMVIQRGPVQMQLSATIQR